MQFELIVAAAVLAAVPVEALAAVQAGVPAEGLVEVREVVSEEELGVGPSRALFSVSCWPVDGSCSIGGYMKMKEARQELEKTLCVSLAVSGWLMMMYGCMV